MTSSPRSEHLKLFDNDMQELTAFMAASPGASTGGVFSQVSSALYSIEAYHGQDGSQADKEAALDDLFSQKAGGSLTGGKTIGQVGNMWSSKEQWKDRKSTYHKFARSYIWNMTEEFLTQNALTLYIWRR